MANEVGVVKRPLGVIFHFNRRFHRGQRVSILQ